MIDKKLLDIIVCPETKKSLKLADKSLIDKINKLIETGNIKNRAKKTIEVKIDNGLVTIEKSDCLYPIREEIPILLTEESISLNQIK